MSSPLNSIGTVEEWSDTVSGFLEHDEKYLSDLNKRKLRENLLMLNRENENITRSLLKTKDDFEALKSELQKALFLINVKKDKRKLLSKNNLNNFYEKQKIMQQQYQKSSIVSELQDLIASNSMLLDECNKINDLLECLGKQYREMVKNLENTFKMKVCKFCQLISNLKIQKSVKLSDIHT